ncbi:Uncharacterised protein [Mycobacteroides abscessus subsp. abscessus]|nr:Uncharacterised protein [Mycobacteroides abscessus subsp. abscessus]
MWVGLAPGGDPLVDARVHPVELLRAYPGILGGVDPATELHRTIVQFVEKLVDTGLVREVHRDVPALHREAQWRFISRAEQLEDVQCRVLALGLDPADDALEFLKCVGWNQELVLGETCWAVSVLPSGCDVEHVIELRQVDDLALVVPAHPVERLADRHKRRLDHEVDREEVGKSG